jgi:hypothetical protein
MAFMSSPSGGGDFKPFLKYNAKAGRWYTKADEAGAVEYEVTNMTAVFDMENIHPGWFLFAAGVAPVKQLDPSMSQQSASPGDGFKRGFEMLVYSDKNLGGVREFASTAGVVIDAMNALHTDWEAAPERSSGKLPVVKCVGTLPITGKHGTNFSPALEIVSWVDRPSVLPGAQVASQQQAAAPPPASSGHTPPPTARAPAPAMAGADDVEF